MDRQKPFQTGLNLVENINSKEAFDLLKEDKDAKQSFR
jgi:hypothetical protein